MTRPIYFTEEDIKREGNAQMQVAEAWNVDLQSAKALDPMDWYVYYSTSERSRLLGMIEFKHRSNEFGRYPTYILSAEKFVQLRLREMILCVPALLVVSFVGDLRWVRLSHTDPDQQVPIIKRGGRYDRNDTHDEEPVVHIPIELFHPLRVVPRWS